MEEMTPEAKAADALSAMSQAIGEMRAQWTEFLGQFGPGLEGQALVILDKFKQLIAKAREFALWAFSEEGQKKIKEYGKMLLWAIGIWYSLKIAVFAVNAATILFEGTMKLVNGAIFLWNKRTKAWAALTKVSTALQWAWNAAMAANPIGVIILAIVALVGIVWYLWKNWDKVWGMISNVFSWIWDKIKWVGSKIWGFATQIFEWLTWPYRQAWDALVTIWGGLGDWFGNIWEGVKEGFSAAWEWITGIFNFDSWVENIKTLWNGLLTVLKSPFNLMIRGVNFLISGLNKISISIPSWVPKIGGKTFGFNFKKLDYLETGTEIGGVKDGTVAQLHKGETVLNAKDSATLQAAVDGGMDYDKLAVALAGALAGMNLKTSVTKEQLNIALTNTEG
jgi:phage-related protein